MPTYDWFVRFGRDFRRLSPDDQARFLEVVRAFVVALRSGAYPPGLRIKPVRGHPDVFEITWAPDGRATFEYGQSLSAGEPHIVWRRIGSHDIFRDP